MCPNKQLIKYITGIWLLLFATFVFAESIDIKPASREIAISNVAHFPKAKSISILSSIEETIYVLYGRNNRLFVSNSIDGGKTFSKAVNATGSNFAHVMEIERPAIAISKNGEVGVSWLETPPDYIGGKIWYAHSKDGGKTFTHGKTVANYKAGETSMVDVAMDDNGNPILTWLNGTTLQFARSFDNGFTFTEAKSIGSGSCECCQPHAVVKDKYLYIAYRGLEHEVAKGDIRDIMLIRSLDTGKTFEPFTRVSDAHWYLSACPISAPSMIQDEDNLYVAWMDGRFLRQDSLVRGDVWIARSKNSGESFMANIRVNKEQVMHNTKPYLAIGSGGKIHVAWEAQGSDRNVLYYAISEDYGQTFSSPMVIVGKSNESLVRPHIAGLLVSQYGHITLAWIDGEGAHLSMWKEIEQLQSR